jgi:hypothetical protein
MGTGRFGRVQLPMKKRLATGYNKGVKAPKPKQENPTRKIVIRRNRNEVRE